MNEIQYKLNQYYEEYSIAPVEEVRDGNGFDYDKMFSSFRCPKKNSCRKACEKAYKERSGGTRDLSFLLGRRALKSASATQKGSTKAIASRVSWLSPYPFRCQNQCHLVPLRRVGLAH